MLTTTFNRAVPLLLLALLTGCPDSQYYPHRVWNVTDYVVPPRSQATKTKLGTFVYRQDNVPITQAFLDEIDRRTLALEACLKKSGVWSHINYTWYSVFVPKNWYTSSCSGEQLVPSTPMVKECTIKGLVIPQKCVGLRQPLLPDCPCVCNHRAVVQNNAVIVTAPNLKLYKAELARLVLAATNPWNQPKVAACLGE
jgi:hypothetical protein